MIYCVVKPLLGAVVGNTLKISVRRYTPRRGLLYVPAHDTKKIDKAFTTDADCITLDCEDGVALNKKEQARLNIRNVLDKGRPARSRAYDLCVRVNSFDSGLLEQDLSTIVAGTNLPDTIYLPKVESSDHIKLFSGYLDEYVKKQTKIGLIIAVESPVALINLIEICKTATNFPQSKLKPVALLFGSDDYCAKIGARRSESSVEVIYARQKLVSVAKAYNLQAIDMVYIKYKDLDGLKEQAEEGAKLGYTGKQMIHPGQVETTQTAFLPPAEEIKWAKEVLDAFQKHQEQGQGGAAAGMSVDFVLFPLDTLKTRLQAAQGFLKAGGFSGVYKGIGPQAVGSAPQAALFFLTYESFKYYTEPLATSYSLPLIHMTGAALGEIVACLIRVPMEVVKQRRQTTTNEKHTSMRILMQACKHEGVIKGLYRGFGSTILREIPFSFIQFPVLEYLKSSYRTYFKNNIPLESWEVANCGALAGGFAAAVTTPLDVAKTRIMLANKKLAATISVRSVLVQVYGEKGVRGLFSGFTPRVLWITLGGYIFFGMYDLSRNFCNNHLLGSDYEMSN